MLILDEPTNHLDVETVEALGRALVKFPVSPCVTALHLFGHLNLACLVPKEGGGGGHFAVKSMHVVCFGVLRLPGLSGCILKLHDVVVVYFSVRVCVPCGAVV